MMSRNKFLIAALFTCAFGTLASSTYLGAQSASDPLKEEPAIVAPVAPVEPGIPADAPATPVDLMPPPGEPPSWFVSFLDVIAAIPAVGNALALIINWMGALAALLTAISSVLLALKKTLEKMGKILPNADKVIKWIEIIYPYVAWMSMYNVQKKPKQA